MGGAILQPVAKGTSWETPPRLGTSGRLPVRIVHRHQHCAAIDLEVVASSWAAMQHGAAYSCVACLAQITHRHHCLGALGPKVCSLFTLSGGKGHVDAWPGRYMQFCT